MDKRILILVLFTILFGCDVRFAGYSEDINGSDAYTDIGYIDTGIYDTIQCEQYKCENLIYGRDDVYVDKESGNIYMVEFGSKVGSKVSSKDLKFFKYDKNGQLIWEKKVGEVIVDDCSGRLWMVDREESFYITKYVQECLPKSNCRCVDPEEIVKFSKEGEEYKIPFTIGSLNADITSIATDDDGNIYFAGEYKRVVNFGNGIVLDNSEECRNTGNPNNPVECFTDVFVAKFNREGKALWAKGFDDDYGGSNVILNNGFVYIDVIGYMEREVDGKKIYCNPLEIIKLDSDGNYKWSRYLVCGDDISSSNFTIDKDGSIYLYGLFDLYPDYKDSDKYKNLNIAKFDNNGEFKWGRKVIGREGVDDIVLISISIADKVIYISGYPEYSSSYFFLSKIAKNGDLIWYKLYDDDKIDTVKVKLSISDDEFFYAIIPIYGNTKEIDNCSTKSFPADSNKKYLLRFVAEPCDNIEVKIK